MSDPQSRDAPATGKTRPGTGRIVTGAIVLIAAIGGMIYWQFWLKPAAAATQCGIASWYDLTGRNAEGKKEDPSGMFAAHKTIPLGTRVTVLDRDNGKSVEVTINDRGPFVEDRILDLTKGAAERIDMIAKGTANVKITVIGGVPAEIKGGNNCKD